MSVCSKTHAAVQVLISHNTGFPVFSIESELKVSHLLLHSPLFLSSLFVVIIIVTSYFEF